MGTAQVAFVGGAVLPEVTCHVRKYVLRMPSLSRIFFFVVVQNVGWGILYDVRVL